MQRAWNTERNWLQSWEEVSREEGTPQGSRRQLGEERFEEGVKTKLSGPSVYVAMTTGNPVMLDRKTPLIGPTLDFWSEG